MITLQYIPHYEFGPLDTNAKIKKILRSVRDNKILVIEGRMYPSEEAELISRTMEQIDRRFKGIEIASIDPRGRNDLLFEKVKRAVANLIVGKNEGLTIIGPATLVREIKKDPNKIELLTRIK